MPDQFLTSGTQTEANPDVRRSLFARLKEETRQSHQELESQLALLDRSFEICKYRPLLESFYGFYVPWEAQVYSLAEALLPGREKSKWLELDLNHLGSDINTLRLCPYVPRPYSLAEAFGSMYVIEGSTLGGQLISRHLEQSFSFSDGNGYRFFRSYGPEVGRRWKSFQASVLANSSASDDAVMVHAANETFRTLHRWLKENGALGA